MEPRPPEREIPDTRSSELPRGRSLLPRGRNTFRLLLAFTVALALYLFWPFRAPLFLAVVLAASLQPVMRRTERLFRSRRHLAATAVTVGVFLVIVAPFAGVVSLGAAQVVQGLGYVRDQLGVQSVGQLQNASLPPQAERVLDHALGAVHMSRAEARSRASEYIARAEKLAAEVVAYSSRAVFHTLIMLVAFYFLLTDGRRVTAWLWRNSPLQARQTAELMEEFRKVTRATVLGTAITAAVQGVLSGIGYAIFHVPRPLFFGLLTALAAFVPMVGTLIVWVPIVVLLAVTGHHGAAIGVFVWSIVFVIAAEHLGKPYLLHGQVEMNTGLVFLALLGGLEAFGLIGIILGPLIVAFLLALLRMYERDFSVQRSDENGRPPPPLPPTGRAATARGDRDAHA